MIRHILACVTAATRHPKVALLGAREFRGGVGLTFDRESLNEAYDSGRELAHIATFRRYEQF